jgi:hypothetical protein
VASRARAGAFALFSVLFWRLAVGPAPRCLSVAGSGAAVRADGWYGDLPQRGKEGGGMSMGGGRVYMGPQAPPTLLSVLQYFPCAGFLGWFFVRREGMYILFSRAGPSFFFSLGCSVCGIFGLLGC